MAAPASGVVSAFQFAQMWRRYNGRMFGDSADPVNQAVNTTLHAKLFRDVFAFEFPERARALIQSVGPSGIGQWYGGTEPFGELTLLLPTLDMRALALTNRSLVDQTSISDWTIVGPNPKLPNLPQMGLSLHTRFHSRDTGSDGDPYYLNLFLPAGEAHFLGVGATRDGGVNPSMVRYRFVPTMTNKFHDGVPFGANQGFYNNETDWYYIITEFPLGMTTYISDAVENHDEFILGYRPKYSATGATKNRYVRNDAVVTPTSLSTTTGVQVMANEGTSGDVNTTTYMTEFIAI